ncbi:MAG: cobalamin-dependent protein [Rhodospirillaceae bacterium]|nr:cobalamin-dependent protein [Rhodospirillaceae bacterium]
MIQTTTIGLVQINNSFSGQNYLPYAVGLLQAYIEKNAADPGRFSFLLPVYKREPIAKIVEHLRHADIVGFSIYVWNHEISLEVARRLKAINPHILTVFGGPHVPDFPEAWLRKYPFIDVAVHNEGEKTFLDILNADPGKAWNDIAGVSFIDGASSYIRTQPRERFKDLDEVPSPFLEGTFDSIMAANTAESWIGLWETNRGCPFRCTFCDWGSATAAKVTKFGMDRLLAEADWFAAKEIEYIFCCDANFGIQKRDVEIAKYVAKVKAATGYPAALSVQNTKNATERAYLTQKILSDAGLNKGVALSMQSVDMTTLKAIKRDNISTETYAELQRRFTLDGVETYSDLILGLPGETYQGFVAGVSRLIENGQHNRIQFNNLSILPNAEMGNPAYLEKFGIQTVRSEIINIHGERLRLTDDVPEYQELVVATASMPPVDWRRTRAFSWMTAFLHFDKIMQIPLMIVHAGTSISYGKLIEAFMDVRIEQYPLIAEIRDFFLKEAQHIQESGSEYVYSKEYLGIYWPADEFMFIRLSVENRLKDLYDEAGRLLRSRLSPDTDTGATNALNDALRLNLALIKQPFVSGDISIDLDHDLIAFYRAARAGRLIGIDRKPTTVHVNRSAASYDDLQRWCREVVWWGNKKGAYLYTNEVVERQLAGHY